MSVVRMRRTAEGVVLAVQAQAGARRNGVVGVHDGRLKVAVTQAPEKGKANRAIGRLLAEWFDVSPRDIQLIAGETSPRKEFLLAGRELAEVESRLVEGL